MSEQKIASKFVEYSAKRMAKSADEIARCVAQLSEAQRQHRGGEHENSVVNLLLHLEGNIRQWMLHGVAERPDVRERDAEFTRSPEVSGEAALEDFQRVVAEARAAILAVTEEAGEWRWDIQSIIWITVSRWKRGFRHRRG